MLQQAVVDQIRRNARTFPTRTAIEVLDGESWTYADVWRRTLALAHRLQQLPELPDRRLVAILLPNGADAAIAHFACQLAGCVAVPLNGALSTPELRAIVADAQADAILTAVPYLDVADGFGLPATIDCSAVPTPADLPDLRPEIDGTAPMVVGYTSGTTGLPKGAVFSNDAIFLRFLRWGWQFGLTDDQVVLTGGPMFHLSYGGLTLMALMIGARVRVMRSFDAARACTELERECTFAFLVPTMLKATLEVWADRGRPALASTRVLLSSGAPISRELLADAIEAFPSARIAEAYGWSEGSWVTFEGKDLVTLTPQSVGWPMIGTDLLTLDEYGEPTPAGVPGEIASRDLIGFSGYLNRPEETAQAFSHGYVLSGDIGVWGEDGRLRIVDRKKDMIVSGGENIYSAEVERVLLQHPAVVEAAVVGRPHPHWGEAVTAVVVLDTGAALTDSDLREFCRQHLAAYKVPKAVEFLDALPRNAMGKVQKFVLRESSGTPGPSPDGVGSGAR